MRRTRTLIVLSVMLILAACKPLVSESDWQTAIAEVKLTAVASITPLPQLQADELVDQEEAEALEAGLNAAEKTLTAQANQIAALQEQVEQLQISLTPVNTLTHTNTHTPEGTPTPIPTATSAIPENQKMVVASGGPAPLYEYTAKNNAGYPVMVKTKPVLRFEQGEWFLIYKGEIRADGVTYFYKVAGPRWGGYYVSVKDVADK